MEEYCAALVNIGISQDEILGVLSDTVRWYGYTITVIGDIPANGLLGPDNIELHQTSFVDLSNDAFEERIKFQSFTNQFLGREQSRLLNANTLVLDFGMESAFYRAHHYLDFNKPDILAKLYLAYLDDKTSWDEFCAYSEVLDKLLINDLHYLISNQRCTTKNNQVSSELLRLVGVGLMNGFQNDSAFEDDGHGGIAIFGSSFNRIIEKEKIYEVTDFGHKFIDIIQHY